MNEILLYEHFLATWNVRGLCDAEAFEQMLRQVQKCKVRVAAIQDIRWNGDKKNVYATEKYTVYYSGSNSMNMLGTGFVVDNRLSDSVLDFIPVNERICVLRMNYPFCSATLLSVLAPTEEAGIEIKDDFYYQLGRIYDRIPHDDVKMILGSFNAHVGRERFYRPIIGIRSLHYKSDDNGKRLVTFAKNKDMQVKSTYFLHKDVDKATYISAGGELHQTDHCIIDRLHNTNIFNIKASKTPAFYSDHKLMKITYRHKLPKVMRNSGNTGVAAPEQTDVDARLEYTDEDVSERVEEEMSEGEQSYERDSDEYSREFESHLNGRNEDERMFQRNTETDRELNKQKRKLEKRRLKGPKARRHFGRRKYFRKRKSYNKRKNQQAN